MLNATVYLTHSLITDELILKDKNVIIIDVLRATSTINIALSNGAKEVIPADTPTKAARIGKGAGNSLLCGERHGKIVEGFNLGNSPLEYTPETVKDKVLVFSTTNGTMSILKAKYAKNCVLASFLNIDRVVDFIKELNEDFVIICSGKLNNFCIEDTVCAGVILKKLKKQKVELNINDPEVTSEVLAKHYLKDASNLQEEAIFKMFSESEHGKYLIGIGFEEDLNLCSKLNSYPALPMYQNGLIKLKEVFDNEAIQKAAMKKTLIHDSAA